MEKQKIKSFFRGEFTHLKKPPIKVKVCPKCKQLPSYYSSSGGFNYYGYYKCDSCQLFVTGYHQFPLGVYMAAPSIEGMAKDNDPKLFVVYEGEHNPEDGWNNFVKSFEQSNSSNKE